MSAAFGSTAWDLAQVRELATRRMAMVARLYLIIARALFAGPGGSRRLCSIEGLDHLKQALSRGRGVLLVGSHCGFWQVIPGVLTAHGFPALAIQPQLPVSIFGRLSQAFARRHGITLAVMGGEAVPAIQRMFRKNGVVLLLIDSPMRKEAQARYRFGFGTIRLDHGAAVLALRHKVPVLYCEAPAGPDPHVRLCLEPAWVISHGQGALSPDCGSDDIAASTHSFESAVPPQARMQAWCDQMFERIARQPGQWHRWSRPNLIEPAQVPDSESASAVSTMPRRTRRAVHPFIWVCIAPLYRAFTALLGRLPRRLAVSLARILYSPAHFYLQKKRLLNFHCVLSRLGRSDADVKALNQRFVTSQARFLVEMARVFRMRPERIRTRASLVGEEHLKSALREGRGVLLLGAHFGTWFYATLLLAVEGYNPCHVVSRQRMGPLRRDLTRMRERFGVRVTLTRQGSSAAAAAEFSRNGIFSTMIDVRGPLERSVFLPFGPAMMRVDLGPARLALRHRVPVILALHQPQDDERSSVRLLPMPPIVDGQAEKDLAAVWLDCLYEEIMRQPEHWLPWGFATLQPPETESARP